jgi:hypothetical protein
MAAFGAINLVLGIFLGVIVAWWLTAVAVPDAPEPLPDEPHTTSLEEWTWDCVSNGGHYQTHHDRHKVVDMYECVGGLSNGSLFYVGGRVYTPFQHPRTEK